ncbi:MAG: hypothetical protein NZ482_03755 [Gloeomargarita sp. SKYG98]|nr:hypothetical protein [Gloeomargarita sp. SKYG98]
MSDVPLQWYCPVLQREIIYPDCCEIRFAASRKVYEMGLTELEALDICETCPNRHLLDEISKPSPKRHRRQQNGSR